MSAYGLKRRPVFTSAGYSLTGCECCKEMVHDDGTEILDQQLNWVRTCQQCKLRVCMECMPEQATVCKGCQHALDTLVAVA